jgi:phosphomannomutase
MFGEEYTLVACADYVLSKTRNTVSICLPLVHCAMTNRNNGSYEASAVGEVNVVDLMKRTTPL